MKTKRIYKGRRTDIFFALIKQLPDYSPSRKEVIKKDIVSDFLEEIYGKNHNRSLSLRSLSDKEYDDLINYLKGRVRDSKILAQLQEEGVRREFTHKILSQLSRIGVHNTDGDYTEVNYHIRRLPISKGRVIPQFETEELGRLLAAVRAYCDNTLKKQAKMKRLAKWN